MSPALYNHVVRAGGQAGQAGPGRLAKCLSVRQTWAGLTRLSGLRRSQRYFQGDLNRLSSLHEANGVK